MNKKSAWRVFFTIIVWALFVLPFVVYVYYACSFSVNVPFWDDYGAVLAFMNNFVQAGALDAKVRLLFSQHNEHRLVFNRVVLLAQYFLIGKIDFKSLMIFGDLGWILTVLVFVFRYKRKFKLPLLHLLPVPYVLLAFVQWENMFFATPSIQFYWLVLFSVVFFFCLMDNKFIQASLLFPIALFTSGGGIILYPLGNLYLLVQRKWKSLRVFAISSTVFVLFYFWGYHSVPYHPSAVSSFINIESTVAYLLVFLGGIIPSTEIAVLIGFLSVVLLIIIVAKQNENDFLSLMAAFILLTASTASLTRSGYGIEQAIAPRYAINALLAWVCIYLFILASTKEDVQTSRVTLIALALVMVYFFGIFLKYELGDSFTRLAKERINSLASFAMGDESGLLYPDPTEAAQILLTSEKLKIYEYETAYALDSPEEMSPILQNSKFSGVIDAYSGSHISGWAFIPGVDAVNSVISILITDDSKTFKLKAFRTQRPDVSKAHNKVFEYNDSGYEAFIATYKIPHGSYRIGILVENGDKKALEWSDKVFIVS